MHLSDLSYATSDTNYCWESIDFAYARYCVKKLQKRIVNSQQNGATSKVVRLQNILVHSFYAKALAVKTVTSNTGKNTPGIDNILWVSSEDKLNASLSLSPDDYSPQPFKNICIKKDNGTVRKLCVPTMYDRAMQTLYKFALEPIAELNGDNHSFGYRTNRSVKDAINHCINVLNNDSCEWILNIDICSAFENLSHTWLMENIPMDKKALEKFIACEQKFNKTTHISSKGIPQGGCLSSVIFNMSIDGLEDLVLSNYPNSHFIRYADDIIVLGHSKETLVAIANDIIKPFLYERGLSFSKEKTMISHIEEGFTYLGWAINKDVNHIYVRPTNESISSFMNRVTTILIAHSEEPEEYIFRKLMPVVTGWFNHHKGVVDIYTLYEIEFDLYMLIYRYSGCKYLNNLLHRLFVTKNSHALRAR